MRRIKTELRSSGWFACFDGDDSGYHGSGPTETEAIEVLLDQVDPMPAPPDDTDRIERCRQPFLLPRPG